MNRRAPTVAMLGAAVVGLAGLVTLGLLPGAAAVVGVVQAIDDEILDFPPLPALGELPERSVVLDRNGEELAVLRAENRVLVDYDDIPAHFVDAVIATEDRQFRSHRGVNVRGILRALIDNARAGEVTGGGSGITQQLVKNLVVGNERTYSRKLQEAVYALELERRMSKNEILEAYLNDAYFGNNAYGVGAAAEFYWGKHVRDIDIAESAVLAGLIRSPERNEPLDHPERAVQRRNVVLDQMAEQGLLGAGEVDDAKVRPLTLDVHPVPQPRLPFFAAYVRSVLDAEPSLGANVRERRRAYERGGLRISTTLDARLQERAGEIIAARLNGGVPDPLGAITALDPSTGAILTVAVGPKEFGSGEGETQVNPAVAGGGGSGRQAGSAFKPFGLVAALEAGISPTYRIDTPSPYEPSGACADTGWTPANYGDSGSGSLDMAAATAASSNVYFAHLVDRTGPEAIAAVARRLGIDSALTANCALALGSGEVFPLEMASAYGAFAGDGLGCEPYAISEIRDSSGRVIGQGGGDCERVLDAGVARRVTALLRGPIESGTARPNAQIDRPAAGKTGTTQDYTDAWFVGYVPQLSVAAWVGADRPAPMEHPACGGPVTGGCLPTMMWRDFMLSAISELDLPEQAFGTPEPLPTTIVPDVVGRTTDRARTLLERVGFSVEVERVRDWPSAGTVTATDPQVGSAATRNGIVTVSVSDGEAPLPAVPDLVGSARAAAQRRLSELGMPARITTVPVARADAYDVVVGQSPTPGSPATTERRRRLIRVTLEIGRPVRAGEVPRTFAAGLPR